MEMKICASCLNAEATKCCGRCNECYCEECVLVHYREKHMKKHMRKISG